VLDLPLAVLLSRRGVARQFEEYGPGGTAAPEANEGRMPSSPLSRRARSAAADVLMRAARALDPGERRCAGDLA
jgi:hypothetical protein